jgi:demethoxyubiquinone hydroxylase (CLK1/Coq7/Cat5 family)
MPTLPIHNAGLDDTPLSPLLIRQSFALGYFSINLGPKAALALPAVR